RQVVERRLAADAEMDLGHFGLLGLRARRKHQRRGECRQPSAHWCLSLSFKRMLSEGGAELNGLLFSSDGGWVEIGRAAAAAKDSRHAKIRRDRHRNRPGRAR